MTESRAARSLSPLVVGHRGASADAPENTLAAFRLALEQGADGVELDVWRCASGEVVVHHDPDTRRTAGAPVRLDRATLPELRALDVGSWKGARFRGERIPTLAEVLAAFPSLWVNVELKSGGLPDLGLVRETARVIRAARAERRCLVSSFDFALLALVRILAPELRCGALVGRDAAWRVRELVARVALRPAAVHPERTLASEERVRAWRAGGLDVNVWTVDDPGEMLELARRGVSAVITNRPALARQTLGGRR